eukprot:3368359-Pyramimonas_sp.AAC.1
MEEYLLGIQFKDLRHALSRDWCEGGRAKIVPDRKTKSFKWKVGLSRRERAWRSRLERASWRLKPDIPVAHQTDLE